MNVLCIDTSGPVAGVSIVRDGAVLYEGAAVSGRTHSESILPMVEEALGRAQLDISEIDLYGCVTGPGSFTGVRIGVSLIKGMAHGAGKPCVGVDALEALAYGHPAADRVICPIQDARAGQVYGAAFLPGDPPERLMPDAALKLDEFLEKALALAGGKKLLFLGDGVKPCGVAILEKLGDRAEIAPEHTRYLRPAAAAELAWLRRDSAVDCLTLMPVYLRAPQAERERARKLGLNA